MIQLSLVDILFENRLIRTNLLTLHLASNVFILIPVSLYPSLSMPNIIHLRRDVTHLWRDVTFLRPRCDITPQIMEIHRTRRICRVHPLRSVLEILPHRRRDKLAAEL